MTVVGVKGPANPRKLGEEVGGRACTLLAVGDVGEVWVIHPFPIVEIVESLVDAVDHGVRSYAEYGCRE